MLTNDDVAVGNKSLSCSSLFVDIEPGVGVKDFHNNVVNNALDAQVESGVTGNNLSIGESADITDLDVAVCIEAVRLSLSRKSAVFKHLLELQAGNNAGYVTGFINSCECIVEVRASADSCKVTGHGNEVNIRILLSCLNHEGLMAVAVGDDQVAALADKVNCCLVACRALFNFVLPDDLVICQAQVSSCGLDTFHMCCCVTLGLIADKDNADLQVCSCCRSCLFAALSCTFSCLCLSCRSGCFLRSGRSAAGCQRSNHHD